MQKKIHGNNPWFDQFIKAMMGFMISLSWPAIIMFLMTEKSDSRADLMQTWHVFALCSLIGIILWLVLNNIRLLRTIALFGIPLLAILLIYYSVSSYASRGDSLYIGNLFYKNAGVLGNVVYAISVTSFMLLSEPAKRIPYGAPLFIFVPYLINFLPDYSGSLLNNLMLWTLTLAGSIGFLNLIVDLIHYLRWEFLRPGESHA